MGGGGGGGGGGGEEMTSFPGCVMSLEPFLSNQCEFHSVYAHSGSHLTYIPCPQCQQFPQVTALSVCNIASVWLLSLLSTSLTRAITPTNKNFHCVMPSVPLFGLIV